MKKRQKKKNESNKASNKLKQFASKVKNREKEILTIPISTKVEYVKGDARKITKDLRKYGCTKKSNTSVGFNIKKASVKTSKVTTSDNDNKKPIQLGRYKKSKARSTLVKAQDPKQDPRKPSSEVHCITTIYMYDWAIVSSQHSLKLRIV